ncbi:MAG TPA: tryptophan-rich sensory protein [Microbacterium sp.]|nr:tryptophan-rich sensory protein [Microbacterium sp.]
MTSAALTDREPRPLDLVRQIVVISALVFMVIAALVGAGVFGGTPIAQAQGGALAADATVLAPATPAFSIWSVIYFGLTAYTIWQALPAQRGTMRQRAMGWWIALTMVLNGLWIVTVASWTLWGTTLAIFVLLAALGITLQRAVVTRMPRGGILDALLIDAVTGLHLGWVAVASVANVTAWLTAIGPTEWADHAQAWGIAVIAVVAVIGLAIARASGWRVAPGLALAWGLVWIAVGRLADQPRSEPIGIAAVIAAIAVLGTPLAVAGLRSIRPQGD